MFGLRTIWRARRALAAAALLVLAAATDASAQTDQQVADKLRIAPQQVERLSQEMGLSKAALERLTQEDLPGVIQQVEHPDLPWKRVEFRLLQERDENGNIPPDALPKAIRQLDSFRARAFKFSVAGVPVRSADSQRAFLLPPTAGIDRMHWRTLGPGNVGGRIRSIVIHPTQPDTMWAGSVGGGVWRSLNGGARFDPVDDLMANLAVSCMVMDPTNPDIIYAGTGEGFYPFDVQRLRGAGIFMTRDGQNWTSLASTATPDFYYVNRLAVSRDGAALLAATKTGLFRSEDAQRLTWANVLRDEVADVDFDPTDRLKAIAGGLRSGRAYYSTDGGKTWHTATHPGVWDSRVELTYAAADPSVVYASVNINGGEVWRSSDGGQSYSRMGNAAAGGGPTFYLGRQGWYDNIVWAGDPTDANLVIVGGVNLWRSTNGGNSFTDISTWEDERSAHSDHHAIVAHPAYNGTTNKSVFFANDGGIFFTSDVRTVGNDAAPPRINGWVRLVKTLNVTQFYGGAGHAGTGKIVGGAQDNGTLLFTPAAGADGWTEVSGGDGGMSAWDPTDANVLYGEYITLQIHRNTDGGATPDRRGDRYIAGNFYNFATGAWEWKPFPYHIPDAKNEDALFVAPFVLDLNNSNRILAGGVSLWRTNDAKTPNTTDCRPGRPPCGPKWASIRSGFGARISAIAIARGNSDIVWVGYENGDVYKTANGTAASPLWEKVDDNAPAPLPGRYCTRIVIDPANSSTVYVMFGGYTSGNIWKTTDGGSRWGNIGNALPEAPIRTLAVNPRNSNLLYLGTEVGLFASEDAGATWSPTNEGPTSCSVEELFWMGDKLVAATHGRGMFEIDLTPPN